MFWGTIEIGHCTQQGFIGIQEWWDIGCDPVDSSACGLAVPGTALSLGDSCHFCIEGPAPACIHVARTCLGGLGAVPQSCRVHPLYSTLDLVRDCACLIWRKTDLS